MPVTNRFLACRGFVNLVERKGHLDEFFMMNAHARFYLFLFVASSLSFERSLSRPQRGETQGILG